MSREDRLRWDQKWASIGRDADKPHQLLLKHRYLLTGGSALDIACGRGQNALWLGEIGYTVLGVDISPIALRMAKEQATALGLDQLVRFQEVDLTSWTLPELSYDLIIVFKFLDRLLFPEIKTALKPGGLLIYTTRHTGILQRDPQANPEYLLIAGELSSTFKEWQILHDREGPENAELVARRPV